jgi:GNAT superfamily N-acetyltransferase
MMTVARRTRAMTITYRSDCVGLASSDLEALFLSADMSGRIGEKVLRAFLKSAYVCIAYDGSDLVGASRAITDGEYHGIIHDVVVRPGYQGQGIGRHMMEQLLLRMPVWRIMLVARAGAEGFYHGLGFEPLSNVMARFSQ